MGDERGPTRSMMGSFKSGTDNRHCYHGNHRAHVHFVTLLLVYPSDLFTAQVRTIKYLQVTVAEFDTRLAENKYYINK